MIETEISTFDHFSKNIKEFRDNFLVVQNNRKTKGVFMLNLRRQNQRFETLIQNADSKRRSREHC